MANFMTTILVVNSPNLNDAETVMGMVTLTGCGLLAVLLHLHSDSTSVLIFEVAGTESANMVTPSATHTEIPNHSSGTSTDDVTEGSSNT